MRAKKLVVPLIGTLLMNTYLMSAIYASKDANQGNWIPAAQAAARADDEEIPAAQAAAQADDEEIPAAQAAARAERSGTKTLAEEVDALIRQLLWLCGMRATIAQLQSFPEG